MNKYELGSQKKSLVWYEHNASYTTLKLLHPQAHAFTKPHYCDVFLVMMVVVVRWVRRRRFNY